MKLDDMTLDVNQHIEINAVGWQHMLHAIAEDCSAKRRRNEGEAR